MSPSSCFSGTSFREPDAAFVNLEILFHDFEPEIIPATQSGGHLHAGRSGHCYRSWFGWASIW